MLVEAIHNKYLFDNPQISAKVQKGKLYIAYAIEDTKAEGKIYFVIEANEENPEFEDLDPLPFPAEAFKVIADRTSQDWINPSGSDTEYVKSFKEWLAPAPFGFHDRAHDWGLDQEDQGIIKRYKEKYTKIYADIISNWHKQQSKKRQKASP